MLPSIPSGRAQSTPPTPMYYIASSISTLTKLYLHVTCCAQRNTHPAPRGLPDHSGLTTWVWTTYDAMLRHQPPCPRYRGIVCSYHESSGHLHVFYAVTLKLDISNNNKK